MCQTMYCIYVLSYAKQYDMHTACIIAATTRDIMPKAGGKAYRLKKKKLCPRPVS